MLENFSMIRREEYEVRRILNENKKLSVERLQRGRMGQILSYQAQHSLKRSKTQTREQTLVHGYWTARLLKEIANERADQARADAQKAQEKQHFKTLLINKKMKNLLINFHRVQWLSTQESMIRFEMKESQREMDSVIGKVSQLLEDRTLF
jgi:ligand-binding sensor domain-containing protein